MNLNAYYGISDQIIVVTAEAGAVFIHGRTGTLYFFQEEIEGFVNTYSEEYLGFWTTESAPLVRPMVPLLLLLDVSVYPASALERGWFVQNDAVQTAPRGQVTLALAFQVATEDYPFMAQATFATAKAAFQKARAAKTGPASPLNKNTIGVVGTSASAGATGVGTSSPVGASAGSLPKRSKHPHSRQYLPQSHSPTSSFLITCTNRESAQHPTRPCQSSRLR